ncbi:MAG TPA: NAD-glutamate dehydrogenase, partial [Casimicrobiaceae bacterium]|nr:NAD-glutamate dehydrogenase [Casimicrobiaceae bacterium]
MKTIAEAGRAQRLDEVLKIVQTRVAAEQRSTLSAFVLRYYGQMDPEDLADRAPADLYGAALSHWNFARRRDAAHARVRVFNPTIAEHGWQSTHTIIEIVNDDMPFLVDSVTMEVNRHGLTLHLINHPIVGMLRDAGGTLSGVGEPADGARLESLIHVEVDRIVDPAKIDQLAADLSRVLDDVRAAVDDWKPMRDRLAAILQQNEQRPPPLPADELAEGRAFLKWLADDHFTFLGYRCHDLVVVDGQDTLKIVAGSSLGILREGGDKGVATSFAALPAEVKAYARRPELLIVTKSTSRSTVHRPGYLDYVAVKRFDAAGEVCGEDRFLGLFTSTAYSASPADIPLLRRKIGHVVAGAGLQPGSHAGKALINILDTYPRDELFQTGEDDLLRTAVGILHLGDRQRFRLFVRRDPFERFLSCLIYVPRESYTTELRQKWQQILLQAFNGTGSEFNVHFSESVLARILIIVRTTPGSIPEFDVRELEKTLAVAARRWDDELKQALIAVLGEARGNELFRQFGDAFPAGYREDFGARGAVADIQMMARLTDAEPLAMSLYRPLEAAPGALRFKLFHLGAPVTLSDSLPMLERMGLDVLDERPHRIGPRDMLPVWMHDFGMQSAIADTEVEIDAVHRIFEQAFGGIFRGEVENDDFNRLVLAARLPATEIVVVRAYAKYLRQIGFPLSQPFIETTLATNAGIARMLVELFKSRFDPAPGAGASESEQVRAIEAALEQVENLSEDRVLRQYLALVQATTRTNFWRRDAAGAPRSFVSFKFDPAKVPGLPEPKPMFEIFVYSPRFEGVHLRGGPVARGGLRWSDRPEDFRTEVLGLVKAQMVKNTVIVPVGSKGGFVLKRAPPPAEREAYLKEGIACYKDYLRGLLDITDNRAGTAIVPPPQVKRHDGDDPYLVVAADKGTATFSDYANAISAEYGFWLGDAFASGGSAGYDHKAMGITARGAWESVKRHFREMGIDTQTADFTVAGIGDMSGDVFGNGMLLSRHTRLVAAFDHRHVFLDPDPDAAASFAERERMFRLPRSSWADYDAGLISRGGGIFPRSAKSIAVTAEVRKALGIALDAMTPAELVNAILKAPVDLIYNGGIGTYVKAASETNAQVGDRGNDLVRVNGRDLRCKVFCEGGNLGCTQLGRVEYALGGGRIFTDAIDNSAGVDTSDHEVNIKILLGQAIGDGELTERQRNTLLATMTDDVAALVLRDNYFQTQAISVTGRIASQLLDAQQRFVQYLEKSGRLNRALEYLPDDEEIAGRRQKGIGLVAPERAVLLAYAKIWLYDELLDSTLPDDGWVATALARYFPPPLREPYAAHMVRHPLHREIIATHVTNSMLNRVGPSFVHRICETTGAKPDEVVRAYLLNREVFGFVTLWQQIEAQDNKIDDAVQSTMLIDTARLIDRGTMWFLRSRRLADDIGATIAYFTPRVDALRA